MATLASVHRKFTEAASKRKTEELQQMMEENYIGETKKIAEKTITKANLLVVGSRMFKWALPLLAPLLATMFTRDPRWFLIVALAGYFLLFVAFFIESHRVPQVPNFWGRTFAFVAAIVLFIDLIASVLLTLAGYSAASVGCFMLGFFLLALCLGATFSSRKRSVRQGWIVSNIFNGSVLSLIWPVAHEEVAKNIKPPVEQPAQPARPRQAPPPSRFWLGALTSLVILVGSLCLVVWPLP